LQFKLDCVESPLKALDNVNRFNGINDTFEFLFIDGFFQHIYFVDKVCLVGVVQALYDLEEEPRAALGLVQDLLQRVARG
jgi:hypothetical protein